jgi:site-specific DNA-cytosine methylase
VTDIRHAAIIPLIGGEVIGAEQAFGKRPEWLASYSAFAKNDSHIVAHYENEVPYHVLDDGPVALPWVESISAVCPCAGLSTISPAHGDDNQNNRWLMDTARYVLSELRPLVFWGENAPGLAGNIGKNVRATMRRTGLDNGYSMTVYRTRSLLHGSPQVRERSFYFFWKGPRTPVLEFFDRPRVRIEDVIRGARGNSQRDLVNPNTPSRDPLYRYVLEELEGGIDHFTFASRLEGSREVLHHIENRGVGYGVVADWMTSKGYHDEAKRCLRRHHKLASGGNIMRRETVVPRDYIGAFVHPMYMMLTHPDQDRYLNYRECMTIMGLPDWFQFLEPSQKRINMVCQNVPVQTARDMASEVVAALSGYRELVDSRYVFQYNHARKTMIDDETSDLGDFFA